MHVIMYPALLLFYLFFFHIFFLTASKDEVRMLTHL